MFIDLSKNPMLPRGRLLEKSLPTNLMSMYLFWVSKSFRPKPLVFLGHKFVPKQRGLNNEIL